METSVVVFSLLKEYDSKETFGFKDDLERSQCLHWLFFWHRSMSGYDFSGQISEVEMKEFPHLLEWIDKIAERPAIKKGTAKSFQNW
ncbi:hypothetical protein BKA65DRAFT_554914 [Rhexocercosporidium sp. MPI-PUGE-AT-0058]|nr:hypothetical protein BKA65DRAFT_554914 [Rhexocercosporidium sp. MPI-PUGE-AT-0058]